MCYKQKCKVVSLNLAHPVDSRPIIWSLYHTPVSYRVAQLIGLRHHFTFLLVTNKRIYITLHFVARYKLLKATIEAILTNFMSTPVRQRALQS